MNFRDSAQLTCNNSESPDADYDKAQRTACFAKVICSLDFSCLSTVDIKQDADRQMDELTNGQTSFHLTYMPKCRQTHTQTHAGYQNYYTCR